MKYRYAFRNHLDIIIFVKIDKYQSSKVSKISKLVPPLPSHPLDTGRKLK